jgi:hypothetical protein
MKRLVAASVLLAATLVVAAATPALPAVTAPATTNAATNASTLYREAVATTRSWSVHYDSSSTESKQSLVVSGDAGPASGSQTVVMGTGSITILVIGGITYVRGNAGGLQDLAGLSASQAADAAGQWIEFATNNTAFTQVVDGVRSNDVATQLLLKGPLTLGHPRALDGYAVDSIDGTQSFARKSVHVVLYVRAQGPHVPVAEDSVNAKGRPTAAEHVTYSKWGELVRPLAPQATVSIGPVSAV